MVGPRAGPLALPRSLELSLPPSRSRAPGDTRWTTPRPPPSPVLGSRPGGRGPQKARTGRPVRSQSKTLDPGSPTPSCPSPCSRLARLGALPRPPALGADGPAPPKRMNRPLPFPPPPRPPPARLPGCASPSPPSLSPGPRAASDHLRD